MGAAVVAQWMGVATMPNKKGGFECEKGSQRCKTESCVLDIGWIDVCDIHAEPE